MRQSTRLNFEYLEDRAVPAVFNSADPQVFNLLPDSVDVGVVKTSGQAQVVSGQNVTYTIIVFNTGPADALGTQFTDVLPVSLSNVAWTSESEGGATGSAGAGSGNISETLDLPVGATVTYTVTGKLNANATGILSNTATATVAATLTDGDHTNNSATDNTLIVPPSPPPLPPAPPPPTQPASPPVATVPLFAVGVDAGANGHVKVFNADSSPRFSFIAFNGFHGGVRVATGDLTGDGVDDIVVGAGPGAAGGHVKVFDGATGSLRASFLTFNGYSGGVNVAIGNIDGDNDNEIIVGTGAFSSHVKVFDLAGNALSSFLAFPGFSGGVTVAAGNFNGVGGDEIIVGAASLAPHVKVFDSQAHLLASFLATGIKGGVNVATGELRNNDKLAEILVSPASSNGLVQLFAGGTAAPVSSFNPGYIGHANGLRIATNDANNDGFADILVASGAGQNAIVKAFNATSFAQVAGINAFDGFRWGVFVG